MKEAIRQRARDLGFDDCRFTTAGPPRSAPEFKRWLREGRHGEMSYLERNAHKRVDPHQVLPKASSVITLAVSYESRSLEGEMPERQLPITNRQSPGPGVIARYAQFHDYHDVMSQRLKTLT